MEIMYVKREFIPYGVADMITATQVFSLRGAYGKKIHTFVEQASEADQGGQQVHVRLSKLWQKIHGEAPLLAKHMNTIWLSDGIELYFTLTGDETLVK